MTLPIDAIKEHLKDGGFKSRKLWLVVLTQVEIIGVALAACRWQALMPQLPTVIGGLIGAAALFITGNVAAKHVIGKQFDLTVGAAEATTESKATPGSTAEAPSSEQAPTG